MNNPIDIFEAKRVWRLRAATQTDGLLFERWLENNFDALLDELESAREEIARLRAALQLVMDGDCHRKTAMEFGGWTLDDDVRHACVEALTGAAGRSGV